MIWKRLAGVPGSVALARAWVRCELSTHEIPAEAVADAALVVSELATNAVLHSRSGEHGGSFVVELDVNPYRVQIGVTDQGTTGQELPLWAEEPDPFSVHGRGLGLVANLAQGWSTIIDEGRCTVLADLPLLAPVPGGHP